EFLPASLAHVERQLFAGDPVVAPLDGSIRWLEGAGSRGTLELVAEGALAEIRAGTPPHEIAVVCPSVEGVRLALGTAFASRGVPVSFESRAALATTPFGYALLSLLRFAGIGAGSLRASDRRTPGSRGRRSTGSRAVCAGGESSAATGPPRSQPSSARD